MSITVDVTLCQSCKLCFVSLRIICTNIYFMFTICKKELKHDNCLLFLLQGRYNLGLISHPEGRYKSLYEKTQTKFSDSASLKKFKFPVDIITREKKPTKHGGKN